MEYRGHWQNSTKQQEQRNLQKYLKDNNLDERDRSAIALLDAPRMRSLVMQNPYAVVSSVHNKNKRAPFTPLNAARAWVDDNLVKQLTQAHTNSSNAVDAALSYCFTPGNTASNLIDVRKSADYFNQAKFAMTFDFETISGNGADGINEIDGITEYAYSVWDKDGGGALAGNGRASKTSLVGVTEQQYHIYKNSLLNKSIDQMTEKEQIAAKWFSRLGHQNSSYQLTGGRAINKSMVDNTLDGLITPENIRRGLDRAKEIGLYSRGYAKDHGTQEAWKKDLRSMARIMERGYYGKSTSVIGFNSQKFDMPLMQWLANQGVLGKNKRSVGIDPVRHFDLFALLDHAATNDPDFTRRLHGSGEIIRGPLTQESVVRAILGKVKGATHTANVDQSQLWDAIREGKMDELSLVNAALKASAGTPILSSNQPLEAGKELFMAHRAIGRSKLNELGVLGMMKNPLDGRMMSANFAAESEGWMTTSNASYILKSFQSLPSIDKESLKRIQEMHPGLNVAELSMMVLSPDQYGKAKKMGLMKSTEDRIFIGTREKLQTLLSGMIHTGHRDDVNESFKLVSGAKDLISPINPATGKVKNMSDARALHYARLLGGEKLANDSAANMWRGAKTSGYDLYSAITKALGDTEKTPKNIREVMELSRKVAANEQISKPYDLDLLRRIGNMGLSRGRVDNMTAAYRHFDSLPALQAVYDYATKNGSDAEMKNFLFARGVDFLESSAVDGAGQANRRPAAILGHEGLTFGINTGAMFRSKEGTAWARGVAESVPKDLMRVSLVGNSGRSLLNQLTRRAGAYRTDADEFRLLYSLAGQVPGMEDWRSQMDPKASPVILANEFISKLGNLRKKDPTAGLISGAMGYDVTGPAAIARRWQGQTAEQVAPQLERAIGHLTSSTIVRPGNGSAATLASLVAGDAPDAKFINSLKKKFGYNDTDIESLLNIHSTFKSDMTSYFDQMLDGVQHIDGAGIMVDKGTRAVGLLHGSNLIALDNVPRWRWQDGVGTIEIGGMKVDPRQYATVSYNAKKTGVITKGSFTTHTSVGRAVAGSWKPGWRVKQAVERGEDAKGIIIGFGKSIASEIYQEPSVFNVDGKAVTNQFSYNIDDIVTSLQAIEKSGHFDNAEFFEHKAFISMIQKGFYNGDGVSSHPYLRSAAADLLAVNRVKVMELLSEKDSTLGRITSLINGGGSASIAESGAISYATGTDVGLDQYGNPSRDTTRRLLYMREKEAEAELIRQKAQPGMKDKFIGSSGSVVNTKYGHAQARGKREALDEIVGTDFTALEMDTTPAALRKRLADHIASGNATAWEKKIIKEYLLLNANLEEGGGMISSRLADAFLQQTDVQKISLRKHLAAANESSLDALQRIKKPSYTSGSLLDTIPIFTFKNGKATMTYGKGRRVLRNEKLMDTFSDFGDAQVAVGARYDGYFNFGFRDKTTGLLASDKDVNKAVRKLAKDSGVDIVDEHSFLSQAEKLYDASWSVSPSGQKGYRKILTNRTDKIMSTVSTLPLGFLNQDPEYLQAIKDAGYENSIFGSKNYTGVEEITTINAMIENYTAKKGQTAGEAFRTNVMLERHRASDLLSGLHEDPNLPGHVGFYRMGGTAVKHGFIHEEIEAALQTEHYRRVTKGGKSAQEAAASIVDDYGAAFKDKGALKAQGGRLVLKSFGRDESDAGIDFDALQPLLNKNSGAVRAVRLAAVDDPTNFTYLNHRKSSDEIKAEIKAAKWTHNRKLENKARQNGFKGKWIKQDLPEFEKQKIRDKASILNNAQKGLRISDRELTMLSAQRFDPAYLQSIEQAVGGADEMKKWLPEITSEKVLGKEIFEDFNREIMSSQFSRSGEDRLTVVKLSDRRYSHLQETYEFMKKSGAENPTVGRAEMLYSAGVNAKALDAMDPRSGRTIESLRRDGFVDFDLSKLAASGHDEAAFLRDFESRGLHNQNLVIDMGKDASQAMGLQGSERYLALGRMQAHSVGGEVINYKPQQQLRRLAMATKDWQNATDPEEKAKALEKMNRSRIGYKTELNRYVHGKGGLRDELQKVETQFSLRTKGAVTYVGMEGKDNGLVASALKRTQFLGKSIAQHSAEKHELSYVIMSSKHLDRMMKDMGGEISAAGGEEAFRKSVMENGLIGMAHRSPTIYRDSMGPVITIFDDTIDENKMIMGAGTAMARKLDSDGDTAAWMLARFKGRTTSINAGRNAAASRYFQTMQAQIMGESVGINEAMAESQGNAQLLKDSTAYIKERRSALEKLAAESPSGTVLTPEYRGEKAAFEKLMSENSPAAQRWAAGNMAKVRRASAGQINLSIFQMQKMRQMMNVGRPDWNTKPTNALMAVMEAAEESFLSPKHSDAEIIKNWQIIDEFNDGIKELRGHNGQPQNNVKMKSWLKKNAAGRMRAFGNYNDEALKADGGKVIKDAIAETADQLLEMFKAQGSIARFDGAIRFAGQSKSSIGAVLRESVDNPIEWKGMSGVVSKYISEAAGFSSPSGSVFSGGRSASSPRIFSHEDMLQVAANGVAEQRGTSHSIMQMASNLLRRPSMSKNIGWGAVGLAAGVMMAGYAGGNPATPPQGQAQADYDEEPRQIPRLTDRQMQSSRKPINAGYVINVRADSPGGKEYAASAIQQAMASGHGNADVRMNMNIREDSSNITDREIRRMMLGAMG